MNPQQRLVAAAVIVQKVQLTFRLFQLEKARDALERELRAYTKKAYEDVQGFLNSSFPTSVFDELSSALDKKCQTVDKLTSELMGFTAEPRVQLLVRHRPQPLGHMGRLNTDVLKFGPMLQNVLVVSSIAKAVQVLGAALSPRQLKHFLIPPCAAIQDDDMMCSGRSSCNGAAQTTSLCRRAGAVTFEEKCQEDNAILSPAVIQGPPLPLPPPHAVFPEVSNPRPVKIDPLSSWGKQEDVAVQHSKQTPGQLLYYFRDKVKIVDELEATLVCGAAGSSPPTSPSGKPSRAVAEDLGDAPSLRALCAYFEIEAPVFQVKRVESSGSLTYTSVIATKTELWDVAVVLTEGPQKDPDGSPPPPPEETSCQSAAAPAKSLCPGVPEFQIKRFKETEVVVSHVVSPGSFYIQHVGCIPKLQRLVAGWTATGSYASQNSIPDIGTQVMAWFPKQEQWFRAQVTKICGVSRGFSATDSEGSDPSIKVEVRRLDFGDTACVSLLHVKELTPDMAVLPLQSAQVSLANVTPVNGTHWSEEAVGWFKQMVHNRTLYARMYPQGPRITVELFLEKGKLGAMRRGAALSLRLAQNGHAKHRMLKNVSWNAVQLQTRGRRSNWEKYLIYTHHKKQFL